MNFLVRRLVAPSWVLFASLSLLAACGDDDSSSGSPGGGSGGGAGTTLSPLEQKLAGCPVVSTSSDPAASACLVGKYDGKTLAGEDCSLQLDKDGAFTFKSPSLEVTHTAPPNTIFVFDHSSVGGFEQVVWKISDPSTKMPRYELNVQARFGVGVSENDRKIQINTMEQTADASKTVTCVLSL